MVIARIPAAGLAPFAEYERFVLALLADHGGTLERRMASLDRSTEVHLLTFATSDGLSRYRADPRRQAAAPLLEGSGAHVEVLEVSELDGATPVPSSRF